MSNHDSHVGSTDAKNVVPVYTMSDVNAQYERAKSSGAVRQLGGRKRGGKRPVSRSGKWASKSALYRYFVTNPNPPHDAAICQLVEEEFGLRQGHEPPHYPQWYRTEQRNLGREVFETPHPEDVVQDDEVADVGDDKTLDLFGQVSDDADSNDVSNDANVVYDNVLNVRKVKSRRRRK